ncbi:MAG: SRPBCC family protein [Kofleriaceae bacterium]
MRNAVQPLLVMSRVFDAPRADVFAEWCDAARLARWWEVRRDGRRRVDLDRFTVAICDVRKPERIVFTWGGPRAETTTLITITLVEDGVRTRWKLEQSITRTCFAGALDRLCAVLHSEHRAATPKATA